MRRAALALAVSGLLAVLAVVVWLPGQAGRSGDLPAPCRALDFEGAAYIVCDIDTRTYNVAVVQNRPPAGAPSTLPAFVARLKAAGSAPALAMNAGMYRPDLSPLGLLIEGRRQVAPVNPGAGGGNFYLKPNGVFFIDSRGQAGVRETRGWISRPALAVSATQSGPLLVQAGRLHPAFDRNGPSRFIRNGVGVCAPHRIVLAISRDPVSFGAFARFFRDRLHCRDALYLDGVVSALNSSDRPVVGGAWPAGPILIVHRRPGR